MTTDLRLCVPLQVGVRVSTPAKKPRTPKDSPPKSKTACLNWTKDGICHFGARCKFQHVGPAAADRTKAAAPVAAAPAAAP